MLAPDPTAALNRWLADFNAALAAGEPRAVVRLFADECFWRDMVAFTWNIVTMEGREDIAAFLGETLARTAPSNFAITGGVRDAEGAIEARLTFETATARGQGYVRLREGRCWTLLTAMTELKGHEEPSGARRALGTRHGVHRDRKTWAEERADEEATLGRTHQPYVLIVGGGQGGIALGARLRRLGVPTIIVEKNARPGDSWRKRYKSLCLHDPVWYDHLPYIPFPDHWPIYSPKDKIADWLEMYVKVMELNYWGATTCLKASFDESAKEWSVLVDCAGERVTLKPKHLVIATGMSGMPEVPSFPGAETFAGEQRHSSGFHSGEAYAGKRAIVIGSNNSAHDIAADIWEHGADVTMIQRSPTTVARSDSLRTLSQAPLFSEEAVARGITTEIADLMLASVPHRLLPARSARVYKEIYARDKDLYDRLDKVGFLWDFGEDGSGLGVKYQRRGSGYYIDVGASELVADGKIKLKSRVAITQIKPNAVVLTDGTELPADLIVYATGYGSMNGWAAELISQEVADKVGKCWGLGSDTAKDPGPWEGELRNMWKPTQQEALWFQGGNLYQARFFSLMLALQLKARHAGIPTPVYRLAPVHHLK